MAPVVAIDRPAPATAQIGSAPPGGRPAAVFPFLVGRIVGRDVLVRDLAELLAGQRLLTVVGPGGMGKTTVAVSVRAERVTAEQGWEVAFVDLARWLIRNWSPPPWPPPSAWPCAPPIRSPRSPSRSKGGTGCWCWTAANI